MNAPFNMLSGQNGYFFKYCGVILDCICAILKLNIIFFVKSNMRAT